MTPHSSVSALEQTPHVTNSTNTINLNHTISLALKRRAESLINNKCIHAESRNMIRYCLEINDRWLPELVRRVDAGETIDEIDFSATPETSDDDAIEEKVQALATMICRAGDEPETKSAALLVLMGTLENSLDPKALANTAKHFAFTRCGELNFLGMVDAQIAALESELLAGKLAA